MALDISGGLFQQRDVRETANIVGTPKIGDFTNAQHNHSGGTSGGFIIDSTIDHDATTNTHNLTTDINHDTITNNHNLTTDINHDTLTNFTTAEHFIEGSINHTNITNIGTNAHSVIDTHLAAANPHSGHVDTTGNETIAGIKTFSSFGITPTAAPTTPYQIANKKYVDDNAVEGGGATKEFMIMPLLDPRAAVVDIESRSGFGVAELESTSDFAWFNFTVPNDFTTLTEAVIVCIPDATETIQWDIYVGVAAAGTLYDDDDRTALDSTKAVTVSQLTELDISGSLGTLTAGDYVGVKLESDTSKIYVTGLRFKYS